MAELQSEPRPVILEGSSLSLSSILFIQDEKQKCMHNSLMMNISVVERKRELSTGLGIKHFEGALSLSAAVPLLSNQVPKNISQRCAHKMHVKVNQSISQ